MKRILSLLLLLAVMCLCFVGCSDLSSADDGKISVVVTAFPHYDFARQITKGVENVEIKMLISPGSEVHTYEPTPTDILALSTCDLFIYTGGESDTWVKGILESGGKNMNVISFMDLCKDSMEEAEKEHTGHDHEHEYDEHVWTSPYLAGKIAGEIAETLIETDGENAEIYTANCEDFSTKLAEIENALSEAVNGRVREEIIVADRFPFYHLAHDFGIKYSAAYSGCSSSTEPSASVIASLSQKVKNESIPYVFTIEFSNQKIAKNIISGTNAHILTLHSCHNVSEEDFNGGITYCDLMMQNAENLRKALCE